MFSIGVKWEGFFEFGVFGWFSFIVGGLVLEVVVVWGVFIIYYFFCLWRVFLLCVCFDVN